MTDTVVVVQDVVRVATVGMQGPVGPAGPSGLAAPVTVLAITPGGQIEWPAMPNAETELFGTTDNRAPADLTNVVQARFCVNVVSPGAAGTGGPGGEPPSWIAVQYSTDDGVTWGALGLGVSPASVGLLKTAWTGIAPGASADVLLRLVGAFGDDAISPVFGAISLQVKA